MSAPGRAEEAPREPAARADLDRRAGCDACWAHAFSTLYVPPARGPRQPMMDTAQTARIAGCIDGYREGHVRGWAWRPDQPHETVTVELLVDGVLTAESTACLPRADLSTAGIGHGHHAFEIPFAAAADAPLLHLTVRAKDGAVLPGGEFDLDLSGGDDAGRALRGLVAGLQPVFGTLDGAPAPRLRKAPNPPRLTFILYAALGSAQSAGTLGMPEYSYIFVLRGYRQVLRRLGTVHVIGDAAEAQAIHGRCLARGESCILLSFTPPQSTPLGLTCPTVPVIAWEFPTIPDGGWSDDPRQDWRLALRQTGRAITISGFAARAVRAGMGAAFPVAFVPTPVWDRLAGLRARLGENEPAQDRGQSLQLDGFVWDSRASALSLTMRTPPFPALARPRPAPVSPMRGAQLALAMASARAQAEAAALLAAAEMAAAPADAPAGADEPMPDPPVPEALPPQAAVIEPEEPAQVTSAPPAPRRSRLRVTAYLARQWYREVLRDVLPAPFAAAISTAGRVAAGGRGVVTAAAADTQAPDVLEAEEVHPAPEPQEAAKEPIAATAPGYMPAPADGPPVEDEHTAPPAGARYLPVGEHGQTPAPQTARYLPAPQDEPLAEAELATFDPTPYPQAAPPADPRAQVRIDGTVFTAVLSPKDGRKNWQDILTAFVMAFTDKAEATLILKMIGGDPSYWWWEFYGIIKTLPPFACRVLVLNGYLDETSYENLIAGTHYVVNASLAEGQCLPLVEFMSAARPAIAPRHTAMLDYISADNAFIVRSDVEFCSWPHDASNQLTTTRHRVEWSALHEAFVQAWQVLHEEPARYAAMSRAANDSVRAYCSDAAVAPALAAFLGLGDEVLARNGWQPMPRQAAEAMLEIFHAPGAAGQA